MRLTDFKERTNTIGLNRFGAGPYPVHTFPASRTGRIGMCWKLTWRERLKILLTGRIWHLIDTHGTLIHRQELTAEKPAMDGGTACAR